MRGLAFTMIAIIGAVLTAGILWGIYGPLTAFLAAPFGGSLFAVFFMALFSSAETRQ
jgi:hypothetical protein